MRKYSNAEKLQKEEAELVKRCKREYPLNMAPVFYVLAIIAFLMLLRSLFSNNIYFTKYSFPGIIFIFSLFCLGIGYVFSHINYKSKFLLDEKIKKEIEHLREKYNNPPES